jgi:hypothetical protein
VAVQVTPWVEPETFATKVRVCPAVNDAVVGDIVTLIAEATRLPIKYVASIETALEECLTLLKAVVASAPQYGVIGPAPAGCTVRNAVTL